MEEYILKIQTNERYELSGTNSTVEVKITGKNHSSTDWHKLDYFFENDFKPGASKRYTVKNPGQPVGFPFVLSFRLVGISFDQNWMVDRVTVKHQGQKFEFPVYDWVEKEIVSIAPGQAKLPQDEKHDLIKKLRSDEILRKQTSIVWNDKPIHKTDDGWGIPRHVGSEDIGGLPIMFSKTEGQAKRFKSTTFDAALNAGLSLVKGGVIIRDLDDYRKLYSESEFEDPPFIDDWKMDAEFGRQVLTGISPNAFERCTQLPNNCNIKEQHVGNMLESGKTLESEIKAGKIYIADYSFTANIKRNKIPLRNKNFQCADCIGLFYVTTTRDFIPIAIQLVPNDVESVFTSTDSRYDWLLAKMYFRATCTSVHKWAHHYLLTHALSETFAVATFRSFPLCHPLHKLLKPHLTSVMAVNEEARDLLLPSDALSNQTVSLSGLETIRYFFKTFNLSQMDLPRSLKERGVDDPTLLPNYHYRDDAMDLWGAIKTYVSNVVTYFYKSNKDVENDSELQLWAYELAHEGFGWQDGDTRGMPNKIESIQELIRICTIIIFTSSAQHAAVNFGQFENHRFVPNAPSAMKLPPHKKGEGSVERIMDSLPGPLIGSAAVALTYAMSMCAKDEVFLGEFVERLFVEKEVINFQKDFKADLLKLSRKFNNRNRSLKYPYCFLLPENIPADINA